MTLSHTILHFRTQAVAVFLTIIALVTACGGTDNEPYKLYEYEGSNIPDSIQQQFDLPENITIIESYRSNKASSTWQATNPTDAMIIEFSDGTRCYIVKTAYSYSSMMDCP